jgi:hypothetical protein
MSTTTTDDEVNDTKCTPSFFNIFNIGVTEKCKVYNAKKKADKEADDKAKRELTNVTPVSTSSQGSVKIDASAKENSVPDSTNRPNTSGEPAASGQPATKATGGWFSKGGKRKSKAKKSKRKNRKHKKSRKGRK